MKRRIREPTAMQTTQIDAEIDSSLLTTVNFMLSKHFLQLFFRKAIFSLTSVPENVGKRRLIRTSLTRNLFSCFSGIW